MASEIATQKAAQAWCTPTTEKIVMIPELAMVFARILDEIMSQSWLGNATTRELLKEIETRIEMDNRETNVETIIKILQEHEDSLSDGYEYYGGNDALKTIAEEIIEARNELERNAAVMEATET